VSVIVTVIIRSNIPITLLVILSVVCAVVFDHLKPPLISSPSILTSSTSDVTPIDITAQWTEDYCQLLWSIALL